MDVKPVPKKKHPIWKHFVECQDKELENHAFCIHCKQVISFKSGLGTMKKHLTRRHAELSSSLLNSSVNCNISTEEDLREENHEEKYLKNHIPEKKKKSKKRKTSEEESQDDINEHIGYSEYTATTDDENQIFNETESEQEGTKLNPALVAVQSVLEKLPKNVQMKAEIDMLNMVYSLYSKHC